MKLEWNAKSKVGSLDYATHKPGGGDKKIITQKVDFKNVQSKVGSKDNLKHKPGGGAIKVSYSCNLHSKKIVNESRNILKVKHTWVFRYNIFFHWLVNVVASCTNTVFVVIQESGSIPKDSETN